MPKPSNTPLATVSHESVPKTAPRRKFSAAEKLRIVQAAAACTERGACEALLRREKIYSSQLAKWRTALQRGGEDALTSQKRGPKTTRDERDERIVGLERQLARMQARMQLAEKLLELQKKASEILGIDLTCGESN